MPMLHILYYTLACYNNDLLTKFNYMQQHVIGVLMKQLMIYMYIYKHNLHLHCHLATLHGSFLLLSSIDFSGAFCPVWGAVSSIWLQFIVMDYFLIPFCIKLQHHVLWSHFLLHYVWTCVHLLQLGCHTFCPVLGLGTTTVSRFITEHQHSCVVQFLVACCRYL